jgi:8-oxo-dGTP pyrophosphatase MutT (NUDIX family)
MTLEPWKILESSYLRPWLRVDRCQLASGRVFEPVVFEFQSWANVLALTPDQEAVLVRQYRHGVREALWELPGGVVERDEDPQEGVTRELLEETGYAPARLIDVGGFYPNPAIQTNFLHVFLALNAAQVARQQLDETEEIEVRLVPLEELIEMTRRGDFLHGLQVAALFRALLYLDRVR